MNLPSMFILSKNHGPLLQLLNENVWRWGPGILVSPISVGDSPVSELSRISRIQTLYVSWHRLHRRECLMCILLILKKHFLQQPTTLPVWWSWATFVTLLTSNWRKQFDHSDLNVCFYFLLTFTLNCCLKTELLYVVSCFFLWKHCHTPHLICLGY